jgi:hypothetical protein
MKKILWLVVVVSGLALAAGAQSYINFTNLPPSGMPYSIPENYGGLHWSGIDYVSCMLYDYANGVKEFGAGFMVGPETQVAFAGGPLCNQKHGGNANVNVCQASISSGIGTTMRQNFRPDYLIAAAGWTSDGPQFITVNAYSNGVQIGAQRYALQAMGQKIRLILPSAWGNVTELKITPSPGGSFVLYTLGLK